MSILDRDALEDSPLADLHAIASELSIDGYRRLRRPELIESIITKQGVSEGTDRASRRSSRADAAAEEAPTRARRSRGRKPAGDSGEGPDPEATRAAADNDAGPEPEESAAGGVAADEAAAERPGADDDALGEAVAQELRAHDEGTLGARRRRGRRGGRSRTSDRDEPAVREQLRIRDELHSEGDEGPRAGGSEPEGRPEDEEPDRESPRGGREETVEGVVELLPNGSGFLRVSPPEPSEEDVYISAAQVKRCELVPGDRISGPRRTPRRSERFASLIRIDTINGRPADEVADSTRFEELPTAFPQERFRLGSEDPTVKAVEWLTPFGRGSRVTIVGPPQAGKTEALRRLAVALAGQEGLELSLALSGVRPEEVREWRDSISDARGGTGNLDDTEGSASAPLEPVATLSFDASADAQSQAVERIVDQARRLAARGGHPVVLIDSLDGLHPGAARKALGAARNIVDGGSVTVIATSAMPVGGETTVIALDRSLASTGRFPALDLTASWTMRPERLVGDAGAEAIANARAQALDG